MVLGQVVLITPNQYWVTWAFLGCCFLAGLFVVIRSAILSANREIDRRKADNVAQNR